MSFYFIPFFIVIGLGFIFIIHLMKRWKISSTKVLETFSETQENLHVFEKLDPSNKDLRIKAIFEREVSEELYKDSLRCFIEKTSHLPCGCLKKDWYNPYTGKCIKSELGLHGQQNRFNKRRLCRHRKLVHKAWKNTAGQYIV